MQNVLDARTALQRIRGAAATSAPAAPAGPVVSPGAKPIGQGGITTIKAVDEELDVLRGTNILRDKQAYYDQLDKFFAALPVDNKPFAATLSVNKEKLKDDNSVSFRYSYLVISQNGKVLRESALTSSATDLPPSVDFPGGDLTLQFRETPTGPVVQTESFNGPWAVFRLIKHPNVKSISRDGNKWTLEYVVTDPAKKAYSLWLVLEFKQPVPDLKDWPVPPGSQ